MISYHSVLCIYREKDLKMCEDLIYAGSSTTSGAPVLTPRQIQDTMMQLRDMNKKLEKGIRDVLGEIESKKKVPSISDSFFQEQVLSYW